MAKGWTTISTINNAGTKSNTTNNIAKIRQFESMMAKVKPRTIKQMKEDGEKHFNERKAQEDSLVTAYQDKKLKSEKAISKAEKIIKFREKKRDKKNKE